MSTWLPYTYAAPAATKASIRVERPDPHADAGRAEVVTDGLGDAGKRSVAGVVTRVEAARIPTQPRR